MSHLPPQAFSSGSEPTAAEKTALLWVTCCDRGLTPEQQIEFDTWLMDDPRHAELFSEFDGTFTLVGETKQLERTAVVAASRNEVPLPNNSAPNDFPQPANQPGKWRIFRAFRRKVWLPLSLAAAAALVVVFRDAPRPAHFTQQAATEIGHLKTVRLPDGSVVELNTDSAINVLFTPAERRVRLVRGEGHFIVAKNANQPFFVDASTVVVRAVGTAFNVRLKVESVDVLVTEGKVQVDVPGAGTEHKIFSASQPTKGHDAVPAPSGIVATAPPRKAPSDGAETYLAKAGLYLSAGHRVSINAATEPINASPELLAQNVIVVRAEEIRRQLAWQDRRLDFETASLGEIVAEFNRYHRRKLVIADDRLATKRFGGSFRSDDRVGFLRMLQDNFSVVAEEKSDETILKLAP